MLRELAAPEQTYIGRDPRLSFSPFGPSNGLTVSQPGAESPAIASRLQREMAAHERCDACSVLMGPAHLEEGAEGLCVTHSKTAGTKSASVPDSRANSRRGSPTRKHTEQTIPRQTPGLLRARVPKFHSTGRSIAPVRLLPGGQRRLTEPAISNHICLTQESVMRLSRPPHGEISCHHFWHLRASGVGINNSCATH